jgi:hypothetical protein
MKNSKPTRGTRAPQYNETYLTSLTDRQLEKLHIFTMEIEIKIGLALWLAESFGGAQ